MCGQWVLFCLPWFADIYRLKIKIRQHYTKRSWMEITHYLLIFQKNVQIWFEESLRQILQSDITCIRSKTIFSFRWVLKCLTIQEWSLVYTIFRLIGMFCKVFSNLTWIFKRLKNYFWTINIITSQQLIIFVWRRSKIFKNQHIIWQWKLVFGEIDLNRFNEK